ncbi:hypothetical protein C8F01DRAFT_1247886 [Mycena amicta]|nr:hypothetical protein C8F01DRAFT_1247886 [Mycena amicta]
MLLACTECQLPYYTYADIQEHYEITHPKIHRLNNRLDVRIVKRILNKHQKTYRCGRCFMPFPHPDLRDLHMEDDECDPEDDSDCEREPGQYGTLRRSRVDSFRNKISILRTGNRNRRSSTASEASGSSSLSTSK